MKKETKQQRVVRALLAAGSSEVAATSRKYRQFTRLSIGEHYSYYFVGKAGALRAGSCASKSISLESVLPKFLAKWAPVNVETAVRS
jgi:hypothetical protein